MAFLVVAGDPSSLGAQQLAAEVTVPIRLTVRPLLAIRSVVAGPARLESRAALTSTVLVSVESNLPYRLTARLAPAATAEMNARLFVRSADGAFERLDAGATVTAALSTTPGQHAHEIVCRAESVEVDRCPLILELSAEYQDMLVRSTATLPADSGLRTADSHHRDGPGAFTGASRAF